jgi:hypothetical protein
VYNQNLWVHSLVEKWAWRRSHDELVDRSASPWDDADRPPSHANRRNALRQSIIRNELSTIAAVWQLSREIVAPAERLLPLAG